MERIWLDHYPPGVPATIDPSLYPSLTALLDECFAKHRDAPACICMDRTLTYREMDAASQAFAAYLQGIGLPRGARVAIMMPNILQYPIAIAAILRAGLTVVNVNPLYKPRELEHQMRDCGAEAIVVLENFAHVVQEVLPNTALKHVFIASLGDMLGPVKGWLMNFAVRRVKHMVPAFDIPNAVSFPSALSCGRNIAFQAPVIGPQDVAFLQYTGGTTGLAKGATLTHRNVVANLLQVDAWLQPSLRENPITEQIVIAGVLPLYHIFALMACMLLAARVGACAVLIPNPRDLRGLAKDLQAHRPHILPAVNTLFQAILKMREAKTIDWSRLRCAVGGGMAVNKSVAQRWKAATGHPIIEGYGLSETSPVLACNRADIDDWTGTIGLPLPGTDFSLRDDDGREVAQGEAGEICARGPQVMRGYWHNAEETHEAMTRDGFFRTGDIGVMDAEGRVRIVDRKKDMIAVSGFKVYPNEVEDMALTHDAVAECAAIGVPDHRTGEAVKLFVVPAREAIDLDDLRRFLARELTHYKVPRFIEVRQELPKTNVGKILRRALRDETKTDTVERP